MQTTQEDGQVLNDPRTGSEPHSQQQKATYIELGGIKCIN